MITVLQVHKHLGTKSVVPGGVVTSNKLVEFDCSTDEDGKPKRFGARAGENNDNQNDFYYDPEKPPYNPEKLGKWWNA